MFIIAIVGVDTATLLDNESLIKFSSNEAATKVDYYSLLENLLINATNTTYDLLIIDIDQLDVNIVEKNDKIKSSILITSSSTFPIEVSLMNPVGYLKKPITKKTVIDAIEKYFSSEYVRFNVFEFKNNRQRIIIPTSNIIFLQSDKNRITVHTKNKEYCFYGKLSELALSIMFKNFLYIHKSFLINPKYIESIFQTYVVLDGMYIPISRSRMHIINEWIANAKM